MTQAPQHSIPDWLRDLTTACPKAGSGVHSWLFKAARQLHAHYPATEICRLLEQGAAQCGRRVPAREIHAAVADAIPCAWTPSGGHPSAPRQRTWPEPNQEQREAITSNGIALADLFELSPVKADTGAAQAIIDVLFPGDPLLCCGVTNSEFDTRHKSEWQGQLAAMQLLVPSPMSARTGTTLDGRPSAHTLSNTGSRRFLVVEFDQGTADEHAAILWHLAGYLPFVLAVHSGGKSLHGWFFVAGQPEEKLKRFMRYAVSLGADDATWTRCQFVRIPEGTRDNGNRQTVYFFDPSKIS